MTILRRKIINHPLLFLAYHEAAHAVMGFQTNNINYGITITGTGSVLAIASQHFRFYEFSHQSPSEVRNQVNNKKIEYEKLRQYFNGYILSILAGDQADRIFNNQPVKSFPEFKFGSDDEAFGDAIMWYCDYKEWRCNRPIMLACYKELTESLYEVLKSNYTLWALISNLAIKVINSKDLKLTGREVFGNVSCSMLKLTLRRQYLPQFNIDVESILEKAVSSAD